MQPNTKKNSAPSLTRHYAPRSVGGAVLRSGSERRCGERSSNPFSSSHAGRSACSSQNGSAGWFLPETNLDKTKNFLCFVAPIFIFSLESVACLTVSFCTNCNCRSRNSDIKIVMYRGNFRGKCPKALQSCLPTILNPNRKQVTPFRPKHWSLSDTVVTKSAMVLT